MKKMSLQWRLTCITTLCIAIICGCLTMFVYKNGVYYMDSLQKAVDAQGDDSGGGSEEIYISIPEDKWDEFSNDFSVQVYNNKEDYKRNSLIVSALLALLGGVAAYFISGHALKPIREFSDKIEEVQAQNLADSGIEASKIKELNQLSVSYNKMLERLSDAFEIQRQFTANAAHELRTPLSLMQVQLDLYHSTQHPGSDADTVQMIKMLTEQNDRLGKMVKTLLDMSELQTVGRDEKIILNDLVDEVLEDLEPLAQEKNIKLIGKYKNITMIGSDILIYRLVYNLVENAIKYNHSDGQVTVNAYKKQKHIYLSVEDTGSGIPKELRERVFEPFFRVDKSRSRELGGVGLGLALVHEIVRVHDGSISIKSKGITHDNQSLENSDNPGQYKDMPILGDLHEVLLRKRECRRMANILNRLVHGSAATFNQKTNVDLSNKYVVLDISELSGDLLLGMFVALDFVWAKAKEDRTVEKAIFVDEAWKLLVSNELAGEYLLEIFKVIRAYGGSAICATQDLVDFFALKGGKLGRGILNNSKTKIILNMEPSEAENIRKELDLSEAEAMSIARFERGTGLISTNSNNLIVDFKASQLEKDLITTDRKDLQELKERLQKYGRQAYGKQAI